MRDYSPLDILIFLFEDYGRYNEMWRAKLDRRVVEMESRSGKTSLNTNNVQYDEDERKYEELTFDLHKCNTNLIFLANLLNFEVDFGAFCEKALGIFEELHQKRSKFPFHSDRMKSSYQQRLAYLVNDSELRQRQTKSLQQRIKSQINLVSRAVIAHCGHFILTAYF